MAKYRQAVSQQTINDATQIAKATQKPGQTKAQTKLIAQGIQKGIEQYKKEQKSKAREQNKRLKKTVQKQDTNRQTSDEYQKGSDISPRISFWMTFPWLLLVISWVFFFLNSTLQN